MSETKQEQPKPDLTPKRQRFVEEYMRDLNGTQAAIRAGYSPHTAQEQSSRLLSKDIVKQAVEAKQAELSAKTGVTVEEIIGLLRVRGGLAQGAGQYAAAIKSAELLGKTLGLFIEKVQTEDLTPQETEGLAALGESLTPEQARIVQAMQQRRPEGH